MRIELTLDMIYKMCGDISSEWNGKESGTQEDRAHVATETMEQVELIKENLRSLGCLV
jgi:hypothetical protein